MAIFTGPCASSITLLRHRKLVSWVLEAYIMFDWVSGRRAAPAWMIPQGEGDTAAKEENVAVAWKTGGVERAQAPCGTPLQR